MEDFMATSMPMLQMKKTEVLAQKISQFWSTAWAHYRLQSIDIWSLQCYNVTLWQKWCNWHWAQTWGCWQWGMLHGRWTSPRQSHRAEHCSEEPSHRYLSSLTVTLTAQNKQINSTLVWLQNLHAWSQPDLHFLYSEQPCYLINFVR